MFTKLIRLGRDAELRSTQNGKQLLSFAGAYDIGFGDNKKTQWIDCTLWGDRAAKVQQYMVKGAQVVITGDDLELEIYQKNDGTQGAKIKCRIVSFDFAGSRSEGAPQQQAQQQHPQAPQNNQANGGYNNQQNQQYAPQQAQQPINNMDNMAQPMASDFDDDSIPF